MYFFYVVLFYKNISQLSQPPPSTPWLSCWHGLPCLAWNGLPRLAGTCLAWICVVMYFWTFGTVITCLSQTPTHVLPCWHGFVILTRFDILGTDLLVFLSYPKSNHLSLFQARARVFHAAMVVMRTRFAMIGWERFAMLGRDLLGVDLCSDVFLNILNSNHLSLSGTDSRFATLARFCHADTVCHTIHGFVRNFILLNSSSHRNRKPMILKWELDWMPSNNWIQYIFILVICSSVQIGCIIDMFT